MTAESAVEKGEGRSQFLVVEENVMKGYFWYLYVAQGKAQLHLHTTVLFTMLQLYFVLQRDKFPHRFLYIGW